MEESQQTQTGLIEYFIKYYDKLEKLKETKLREGDIALYAFRCRDYIKQIFGEQSSIHKVYNERIRLFRREKTFVKNYANLMSELEIIRHSLLSLEENYSNSKYLNSVISKNIFIVHGHDELNKLRLYQLLKDEFQLNPFIMSFKPGESRHLLDKFEFNAKQCSYAIALLTKDDIVEREKDVKLWQARPNVIFEVGWFIGKLGRKRLLILLQQGTNIHSDYDGVSRIQFNNDIKDKFLDIKKELEAVGII
jgi:predicted nucleotide-binding protein